MYGALGSLRNLSCELCSNFESPLKVVSSPSYLVSQSPSVCSSFGPIRTPLVFCGTEDGCVLLWDLRETVAMHTRPPGVATPTSHTHIPRPPTFSTGVYFQNFLHFVQNVSTFLSPDLQLLCPRSTVTNLPLCPSHLSPPPLLTTLPPPTFSLMTSQQLSAYHFN